MAKHGGKPWWHGVGGDGGNGGKSGDGCNDGGGEAHEPAGARGKHNNGGKDNDDGARTKSAAMCV